MKGPPATESDSTTKQRKKRKSTVISYDILQQVMHLPAVEAAAVLGMSHCKFKKLARKSGCRKWPHRRLESLMMLRSMLEEDAGTDEEQKQILYARIEEERELMLQDPLRAIPEDLDSVRNILWKKRNYVKRKAARHELRALQRAASAAGGASSSAATALGKISKPVTRDQQKLGVHAGATTKPSRKRQPGSKPNSSPASPSSQTSEVGEVQTHLGKASLAPHAPKDASKLPVAGVSQGPQTWLKLKSNFQPGSYAPQEPPHAFAARRPHLQIQDDPVAHQQYSPNINKASPVPTQPASLSPTSMPASSYGFGAGTLRPPNTHHTGHSIAAASHRRMSTPGSHRQALDAVSLLSGDCLDAHHLSPPPPKYCEATAAELVNLHMISEIQKLQEMLDCGDGTSREHVPLSPAERMAISRNLAQRARSLWTKLTQHAHSLDEADEFGIQQPVDEFGTVAGGQWQAEAMCDDLAQQGAMLSQPYMRRRLSQSCDGRLQYNDCLQGLQTFDNGQGHGYACNSNTHLMASAIPGRRPIGRLDVLATHQRRAPMQGLGNRVGGLPLHPRQHMHALASMYPDEDDDVVAQELAAASSQLCTASSLKLRQQLHYQNMKQRADRLQQMHSAPFQATRVGMPSNSTPTSGMPLDMQYGPHSGLSAFDFDSAEAMLQNAPRGRASCPGFQTKGMDIRLRNRDAGQSSLVDCADWTGDELLSSGVQAKPAYHNSSSSNPSTRAASLSLLQVQESLQSSALAAETTSTMPRTPADTTLDFMDASYMPVVNPDVHLLGEQAGAQDGNIPDGLAYLLMGEEDMAPEAQHVYTAGQQEEVRENGMQHPMQDYQDDGFLGWLKMEVDAQNLL